MGRADVRVGSLPRQARMHRRLRVAAAAAFAAAAGTAAAAAAVASAAEVAAEPAAAGGAAVARALARAGGQDVAAAVAEAVAAAFAVAVARRRRRRPPRRRRSRRRRRPRRGRGAGVQQRLRRDASEFAEDAKLPTATAGQRYFCDTDRPSNAPGWCEFRYDGWTVDYCCVSHGCDGGCRDTPAAPPPPSPARPPPPAAPPPPAPCTAHTQCNSGCSESPSDTYDRLGLPPAEAGSCYFCDTYLFSDAPDWCTWRWDAPMFESDLCCVKHTCSGVCSADASRRLATNDATSAVEAAIEAALESSARPSPRAAATGRALAELNTALAALASPPPPSPPSAPWSEIELSAALGGVGVSCTAAFTYSYGILGGEGTVAPRRLTPPSSPRSHRQTLEPPGRRARASRRVAPSKAPRCDRRRRDGDDRESARVRYATGALVSAFQEDIDGYICEAPTTAAADLGLPLLRAPQCRRGAAAERGARGAVVVALDSARQRLRAVDEVLASWQYLEVYLIAIILAILQLLQISRFIIMDADGASPARRSPPPSPPRRDRRRRRARRVPVHRRHARGGRVPPSSPLPSRSTPSAGQVTRRPARAAAATARRRRSCCRRAPRPRRRRAAAPRRAPVVSTQI